MNLKKLALGVSAAAICLGAAQNAMAEKSLTDILAEAYSGTTVTEIFNDQVWFTTVGGKAATVVAKYAGYNNDLYTANMLGVLDSPAIVSGSAWVEGSSTLVTGTIAPNSNPFLFADRVNNSINYYTDDNLNGKENHVRTFQIGDFDDHTYVIAWEDLPLASSDKDYNDLVVEVKGVTVPDGATTMMLLGGALCGIGAVRRRLGL